MADSRIIIKDDEAEVLSSSGKKKYVVRYDPAGKAIMANDNGSYWQDYLGYPAIAYLLIKEIITYDTGIAGLFAGIAWKDINTKFKNDYQKTEAHVLAALKNKKNDIGTIQQEIKKIYSQLAKLNLGKLGKKIKPPKGY